MIEQVSLGKSRISASRLCFGTGTNGWEKRSNQGDLGLERLTHLLRYAWERGITFWDTADQYGTHAHVAAALRELDRASVTVATKTVSRTPEEVRADVERFRRELDTDYIDIFLLHCMTDANWPATMAPVMDVLSEFKERGVIGALGCSCHDIGALNAAAESAWVDVNLVRINYAGHAMCAGVDEVISVIERMSAAGQGVYGMKVMGGGSELTSDPEKAVRFVLDLDVVHALVIGMMDEEQILENTGLVSEAVTV
jgi:aryl-alcohol dehydrogenase-like predicted oxidoreductase